MFTEIPTATEQLKFLKKIQRILQSGKFTSTYKFALLISLTQLSIEQGDDSGAPLTLEYVDIAEKFIDLYWRQSLPFQFESQEAFVLLQNKGSQAGIVNAVIKSQNQYKTIAALKNHIPAWQLLIDNIASTIKLYPVAHLQNIDSDHDEFLYSLRHSTQHLILLPKVAYCLRQFSGIIEELCQKAWMDHIRLNKKNGVVLSDLPDLETFLFKNNRSSLGKVTDVLKEIQNNHCFYCGKKIQSSKSAVDHFIPWSLYSADTGHNFVLADSTCNSKKSNFLADIPFYEQWQQRNHDFNGLITQELSSLGFLTDLDRSANIANWAYEQAKENNYTLWCPK